MRLSAKSRYALAALVLMERNNSVSETAKTFTVTSMSESLGISKIYLEQVFALLKRGKIVSSSKGAYSGYRLARSTHKISAYDILTAIELSLFETADLTVDKKTPAIEKVLQNDVFGKLDSAVSETLKEITLDSLAAKSWQYSGDENMYYL